MNNETIYLHTRCSAAPDSLNKLCKLWKFLQIMQKNMVMAKYIHYRSNVWGWKFYFFMFLKEVSSA